MRFLVCVALLATVGVPVHGAFVSVPAHGHATVRSRNHAPVVALFGTKVKPAKVAAKRSFSFFPIPDGAKKARNQNRCSSFSLPDWFTLSSELSSGSEGRSRSAKGPSSSRVCLPGYRQHRRRTSGRSGQSPSSRAASLDNRPLPSSASIRTIEKRQVKLAQEAAESEAARKRRRPRRTRITAEKAEADKIAAEKAAKEKEAAEKAAKEKEAAAAAVAKAKAAAEAEMAARAPPSPKELQPSMQHISQSMTPTARGKPAAYQ